MLRPYILEEIAELEVQFPAGLGVPKGVNPIEAVGMVDAEGTEWRNDGRADARAPEQPGGIELCRPVPYVAGIEKRREVQHLGHAHAQLARHREEGLTERVGVDLRARIGIVAEWRHGAFVVAAQRDEELRATQREELLEERRGAEHEARPRREPQHEFHV